MRRALLAVLAALLAASTAAPLAPGQTIVTVVGKVVDVQGRPVDGATVNVYQGGALVTTTTTSSNGLFTVYLEEGVYTLSVYKRGYEEKELKLKVKTTAGSFQRIKVELGYALQVVPETTFAVIDQGEKVAIALDLINRGYYVEEYSILIAKPPGWTVDIYTETGIEILSIALKPGGEKRLKLVVAVPRNATGVHNVTLMFQGAVSVPVTLRFKVNEKNWMFLTTQYSTLTGFLGERVEYDVVVQNTLPESAVINLRVDAPGGWVAGLMASGGKVVDAIKLEPGESVHLTLFVDVPATAEPGRVYEIRVTATADGARSVLPLFLKVERGRVVIRLESTLPYVSAAAGDAVQIPIKVYNEGLIPALIRLNVTKVPSGFEYLITGTGGLVSSAYIKPGEEKDFVLNVRVPRDAKPGTYTFRVIASGGGATASLDVGVNVVGVYNMSVLTQNFYVSTTMGSRTKFALTLMNTGSLPLRNLRVEAYDLPGGFHVSIYPRSVALVKPGEKAEIVVTIDVSEDVNPGFYNVPLRIVGVGVEEQRVIVVEVKAKGEMLYYIAVLVMALAIVFALLYREKLGFTRGQE